MRWMLGDKHPDYGTVEAMGMQDGEKYRMFLGKDKSVTLMPLDALPIQDERKEKE